MWGVVQALRVFGGCPAMGLTRVKQATVSRFAMPCVCGGFFILR
jgi:hypothetical protein